MENYVVYVEAQDERLALADMEFFSDKDAAVERFNCVKSEYQHNPDWSLSDEFDADDVTDSNNSVLFIHNQTEQELYVNIETVTVK